MNETLVKKPKKEKENLKQRAYLNSVTSIIDYAGGQITGFIISPFIVNGLGSSFYGVWQMLGQMTGYASMADIRATQVLKWSIAKNRDIATDEELQSDVTTAFLVTLLILPVVFLIGGAIIWYAPYITQLEEQYFQMIRIASAILILSLIINKVFNVFESVLRGMNLGYRRMGVRFVIVAIGGALKVLAIIAGFGIIGLSAVELAIGLVTGITFYYIVKKNVPWFGFGKTNRKKMLSYGVLSGWFMAFTGSKLFLLNSDKIILGYLAGPVLVAQYTITMFASFAIQGLINAVTTGIIPGIGGLFGKQEFDKVRKGRRVIITLNWLLSVSFGVAVIFLNRHFIALWIDSEQYAGHLENFLILLLSIQIIFFQLDSLIINVTLKLKRKVLFSALASASSLLIAFLLVERFEIAGLCLSLLAGRLILTIGYPSYIKKKMHDPSPVLSAQAIQPLLAAGLMFLSAYYLQDMIQVESWAVLVLAAAAVPAVTAIIFWFTGIRRNERDEVWKAISKIKVLKKD